MREPSGRVCLDPGHDAGNLANRSPDGTYYEQEFTLDLGKRLEKLLTDRGVAVTLTRTGGEAVSLAKRCEIANSIPDLDLFVSIHSNAAGGSGWSDARGWSVYIYGPGLFQPRHLQTLQPAHVIRDCNSPSDALQSRKRDNLYQRQQFKIEFSRYGFQHRQGEGGEIGQGLQSKITSYTLQSRQ